MQERLCHTDKKRTPLFYNQSNGQMFHFKSFTPFHGLTLKLSQKIDQYDSGARQKRHFSKFFSLLQGEKDKSRLM